MPTQRLGARHALLGRAVPWGTQQLPSRYFQQSAGAQFELDREIASLVHQEMKKAGWAIALEVRDFTVASP